MFWRRRKLPEDDEPLVPHGLIWQATEEPGSTELPPDMWDTSPRELKRFPSQPVEMPVRPTAPVPTDSQPSQTAPPPGELSPPVKWPRVDDAEIARRAQLVDTAVSFPYRKPILGAAVPKPIEADPQEREQPAKLELVSISPSTPYRAARAERFNHLVSRFRSLKLPKLSLILERVRRAGVFVRTKDGANRGVQAATQGLKLVRQKSGPALDAARLRWVHDSRAAVLKSRSQVQRIRENLHAIDTSGFIRIWQRAHTLRVTIRIPASNWRFIHSLRSRAKDSALDVQRTVQKEPRLWASVAMGGFSALLALGVISALRHYQQSGRAWLPHSQQTVDAVPASPTTQRFLQPAPARETTAQKPSPVAGVREQDPGARRPSHPAVQKAAKLSPGPTRKPRVRRNKDEDDYVAADTYVYYGLDGKPKR